MPQLPCSQMSREAILASRPPLKNSTLHNLEHPQPVKTKCNNALYDNSPEVINAKRQHQPTAAHKEHAAQVQKSKDNAERRAIAKAKSTTIEIDASANDEDQHPDLDLGSEDELNLSPNRKKTHADGMAYNQEQLDDMVDDIFAEAIPEVNTPTRVTKITATSIERRKTKVTNKQRTEDRLEVRNLERLRTHREAEAAERPHPLPSQSKLVPRQAPQALPPTHAHSSPAPLATKVVQPAKRARTLSMDASPLELGKKARTVTLPDMDTDTDLEDLAAPVPTQDEAADAPNPEGEEGTPDEPQDAPVPKKKSKKVKIEDLTGDDRMTVAMNYAAEVYYCKIMTVNPYPDLEEDLDMKADAIDEAYKLFKINRTVITKKQIRYIGYRTATIRGRFKILASDFVADTYGFSRSITKKAIAQNKKLVELIKTDYLFTYKEYKVLGKDDEGKPIIEKFMLYGNYLFIKILAGVLFKTRSGLGFRYKEYFQSITLPLLALVATAIECAIDEFETGTFIKVEMTAKMYANTYLGHLAVLEEWRDQVADSGRFEAIQVGFIDEAR